MHFLSVAANIANLSGPFNRRREKRGKRTATCKPCIAQIHGFTKSAFQRRRNNTTLYLELHHLTTHQAKNWFPIKAAEMLVTENNGHSSALKQFCAAQLVNVRRMENRFLSYP